MTYKAVRACYTAALVTLLGATSPLDRAAAQTTPAMPPGLDQFIHQVRDAWALPGLAIAVVHNDSVLVTRGYGVRELGKADRVDANTVFDIASLTKSFTGTAVAMLVDEGRVHWDDPVRRHLPGFALRTPSLTAEATLRDFLSHRTGLEAANTMWRLTAIDRGEVVRRARFLRSGGRFRQDMVYSNVGYTVAGEAAAAAAGTTFEALLRERVIGPLRLSSTTATYEQAAHMPNVASSHMTIGGRQQPIRRETQRAATAPAGAVQSTANDIARWMRLHLNNGTLDGKRFVSDSAMRALHSLQVSIPVTAAFRAARHVEGEVGYGLGWNVMDYRGHPMLWHSGSGDGQIAYMAILPRNRLGVAVFVNTWIAPTIHGAIAAHILDAYLGTGTGDLENAPLLRGPRPSAPPTAAAGPPEARRGVVPAHSRLSAYVGSYADSLFGPIHVRLERGGLTLQMGEGEKAELQHQDGHVFTTRWRDPVFRELYPVPVTFMADATGVIGLRTQLGRDEVTASRTNGKTASGRRSR